MPASSKQPQRASSDIVKVNLGLRVENNNKHIRGKKKVRQEIEDRVLSRYQMKKDRPDGWDYQLSIPYETDKDLDEAMCDFANSISAASLISLNLGLFNSSMMLSAVQTHDISLNPWTYFPCTTCSGSP
jgi:hypothetical protein